jgi:hypothetical protein
MNRRAVLESLFEIVPQIKVRHPTHKQIQFDQKALPKRQIVRLMPHGIKP